MFRIGDFSRLSRVTIRTLHHYDEAGLLRPAHVDERTGYRYYTAAQLETLQRVLLLRDLGFALEDVRGLLASTLSPHTFLATRARSITATARTRSGTDCPNTSSRRAVRNT